MRAKHHFHLQRLRRGHLCGQVLLQNMGSNPCPSEKSVLPRIPPQLVKPSLFEAGNVCTPPAPDVLYVATSATTARLSLLVNASLAALGALARTPGKVYRLKLFARGLGQQPGDYKSPWSVNRAI